MTVVLALHAAVLLALVWARLLPAWALVVVAALLVAGLVVRDRRLAATSVGTGLAGCGALLVALSEGGGLAHVHAGVLAALVPLYRQWRPVAAAGVALLLGYGWAAGAALHAGEGTVAVAGALLAPALLVAVVALVSLAWWGAAEQAEGRADDLASRLEQREGAVTQRLEDVETLKAELIAMVSHEFRTPLTSLTGYARTLASRMDQLPPSAVHRCVSGIDHHATRLARLVHNVLAADGDVAVDPHAITDLAVVARLVAGEALETHGNRVLVHHELPPSLRARVDLLGAHRILGNLLDNAVKFAPAGSVVEVRAGRRGAAAVVEVSNRLDGSRRLDLGGMFEPFVQADSSETRGREGMGLGLHVARRLTVAHGGELAARLHGPSIILRLVLPAAVAEPLPAEVAERLPAPAHDPVTVVREPVAGPDEIPAGDGARDCYRRAMDPSTRRLTEFSHGAG